MKRSNEIMEAVSSFRARLDLSGEALGQKLSISMDMELSRNDRIRNVMEIESSASTQTIEQVVDLPFAYTKLPGEGWVRMDMGAMANLSGTLPFSDPREFTNSFFPAEDTPWELYNVASRGREEVDGVQTERLNVQFDFQEVWEYLDSEIRDSYGQSFGVGGEVTEEFLQGIEIRNLDVWVDDQGYARRFEIDMVMGEAVSIFMNMRVFDFNQDINISLPQEFTQMSP